MADPKIRITADTSQPERAIDNLERALNGISATANAAGKALAGITAAAGGVAFAFKGVTDQYGELADLGKVLDLSAKSLLNLQRSAQLAGIDAGELNQALFRLRGNLGEALIKGTGPAKEALDRLNVSVRELSRLPADQQMARITESLRQVQNPAERAALAIDLLGKQGPRLLEVADNAARLAEQAQRMGLALSDIEVRNLEQAGDAIDELAFIARDTLNKALAQLAPYMIALKDSIIESIDSAGGLGNVIADSVIPALRATVQVAAALAAIFVAGKIVAGVIAITTAVIGMYNALKVATTAAGMLNAVMGKNPILKIVGAVTALAGAAFVVNEVGNAFDDLDAKVRDINAKTKKELETEKTARKAITEEVAKLTQEQEKALKALEDTIGKLEQAVQFERDRLNLGEVQANINKTIREENEKLEKVGMSLTDQQRERIALAHQELKVVKDQADIQKAITDYTREQTELEKINRGINLQKTLGGGLSGGVTSQKEYQRDMEALRSMLDYKLISETNENFDKVKHLLIIPEKPKTLDEIQQEFDEKIDELIENTKNKFYQSKYLSEKLYNIKFDRIIEDFEYAREHGQFMPNITIGTLSGSYLVSNGGGTGLSVGSYETSFVIKQGNKHEGYYTIGNRRYFRYYMPEKPNRLVRFFMKTCLGFFWVDDAIDWYVPIQ